MTLKKVRSSDPALIERRKKYSTKRWGKLRAQVLKGNPLCSICRAKPADTVDHIQHHRGDPMFYDLSNLRPACRACNSSMGRRQVLGMRGAPSEAGRGRGVKSMEVTPANPLLPQNERFAKNQSNAFNAVLARFINKAKEKDPS